MERRDVFLASALLAAVPLRMALGCSASDAADESGDTATARGATESASTTTASSSTGTMTAQSSGGGTGESGDTSYGAASSTTGSTTVSPIDCRNDGDGRTTLVFVNRCAATVTVRGSDIEDSSVASGDFVCVDIGSATEELPSKRYWGFVGADPGAEHHTLAEFTFNTDFNDFDWYNISHVDAFNLPLQIVPVDRPDCATLTCAEDLVASCPDEGRFEDENGELVACVSPDRDDGESPVALYFESCADAYAWSGDDQHGDDPSPVRACAGEDWDIVFCPAGAGSEPSDALGAHPVDTAPVTRGGTMTFTNVGAEGWWPRRLDREPGDPACDYKDGTDTWGGHCCMTEHDTTSRSLSPFDEEMTLILKAIHVKQLAVYQPDAGSESQPWRRVTAWDSRGRSDNLWFTQEGEGSPEFPGDLTQDDCVGYVMQQPSFDCEDSDYYCPDDPGILHQGFSGSKLVVFLGSMNFGDDGVRACGGDGAGHPGPWVAFVASELVRDGGRKWNGLCNCYSKTGSVGDGCGEINVFEVVMDGNEYSNREFASTGLRSFQAGHVGGAVCGSGCERGEFPEDVEVVDACAQVAYDQGPELEVGGASDGCPVWRRPDGDRYFLILLDRERRMIQVGVIHPEAVPEAVAPVLPDVPAALDRSAIDALLDLRLPE